MRLYHVASREAWFHAKRHGSYVPPSLNDEGFIHCSTARQLPAVARRFYQGQTGLVLLEIDTDRLAAGVQWEQGLPPDDLAGESTFPHVYGGIDLEAVVQTFELEPDQHGEFSLPPMRGGDPRLEGRLSGDRSRHPTTGSDS